MGTSGFAYRHWRGGFYPLDLSPAAWLRYYASQFNAVELNVTFYRLPERATFIKWADSTPDDFEFAVKGSRLITHYHRMRDVDEALAAFFTAAEGLGPKLSTMLWQLPPRDPVDLAALSAFCDRLPQRVGEARVRHAFEFRDARWFSAEVLDELAEHGHALVIADPPPKGQPDVLTADFAYRRFHHGNSADGGYTDSRLSDATTSAARMLDKGRDVYGFFNIAATGIAAEMLDPRDRGAEVAKRRGLQHVQLPKRQRQRLAA